MIMAAAMPNVPWIGRIPTVCVCRKWNLESQRDVRCTAGVELVAVRAVRLQIGSRTAIEIGRFVVRIDQSRQFRDIRRPRQNAGLMQDRELVRRAARNGLSGLLSWAVFTPSGEADWMPKTVVFFSTQGLWHKTHSDRAATR